MDMESIAILGRFGPPIYHFMYNFISLISNLISCREYILKGKKENCTSIPVRLCMAKKAQKPRIKKL